MTRSGIKRGLAVTAISALAITGVPALATSAHAVPLSDQTGTLEIISQGGDKYDNNISLRPDGTNDTASLVATGPTTVTQVLFQYSDDGGTTWTDINGVLARNAHGVFTTEWDVPTALVGDTVQIRALGNGGAEDIEQTTIEADAPANPSIELATEGALGIYRNTLTNDDNVAVRGTTSDPVVNSINVFDNLEDANGDANYGRVNGLDSTAVAGGGAEFSGVLEYPLPPNGYNFSNGTAPDQVALTAAVDAAEDTEASTYYLQDVTTVTAEADRNPVNPGGNTDVTVTVTDQNGEPVAGATVGYLDESDGDTTTPAVDEDNVGTTDANGQITLTGLGAGTYTAYVDEGTAGYQAASDIEATEVTINEEAQQNTNLTVEPVDEFEGFTNFDLDEFDNGGADFVATLLDQNGQPVQGQEIEYRFVFDDDDGTADPTDPDFTDAAAVTDANGQVTIPFTDQGAGEYTLEIRRPNVGGTGLLVGQPFEFNAGEAEIEWAEGDSASSPVNGEETYQGTLALTNAGGAALQGREVTVDLDNAPGGPSAVTFSDDQPANTTRNSDTEVTATTGANGGFSVSLTDPEPPPLTDPVSEDVTLLADAEELSGTGDAADADAMDELEVTFEEAPEVSRIDVNVVPVEGFDVYAPGKPAAIDVDVFAADGDDDPTNDAPLEDQAVTVSVDKGFLSPSEDENADGNIDVNDLVLDEGQNAAGELFGFYDELGQSQELQTDDGATSPGDAQIVAAIERDPGFDDDGRVEMEITVTSGGETVTETVTFDSRDYLNLSSVEFVRDPAAPQGDVEVPGQVDFNLFAKDQFGNLVGDVPAAISDDTPVAEVITDGGFGNTQTDYAPDNSNVRATSDEPVVQTLQARLAGVDEALVDDAGNIDEGERVVTETADPINWVEGDGDGGDEVKKDINPALKLRHIVKGRDRDRVIVRAMEAEGADVKLFRIVRASLPGPRRVLVRTGNLNAKGNAKWFFRDGNGFRGSRRFKAVVFPTADTNRGNTQIGRVR